MKLVKSIPKSTAGTVVVLLLLAALSSRAEVWEHGPTQAHGYTDGKWESLLGVRGFSLHISVVGPQAAKLGIQKASVEKHLEKYFSQAGLQTGQTWMQSKDWEVSSNIDVSVWTYPAAEANRFYYDISLAFEQAVRLDRNARIRIYLPTWSIKTHTDASQRDGGRSVVDVFRIIEASAEELVSQWRRANRAKVVDKPGCSNGPCVWLVEP
jgi:hypothetical protein